MEFNARLPAAPARARCFLHPQASLLWCRKKILQAWKMLLEGSDCPPDTSSPPAPQHPTGVPCTMRLIICYPQGYSRMGGGLSPSQRPLETSTLFYGYHKSYFLICTPAGSLVWGVLGHHCFLHLISFGVEEADGGGFFPKRRARQRNVVVAVSSPHLCLCAGGGCSRSGDAGGRDVGAVGLVGTPPLVSAILGAQINTSNP